MSKHYITIYRMAFSALLFGTSLQCQATNGFNLIGFGTESTLMGGADVAVARDTSALNTNPAGLAQISGRMFNGYGSVLRTLDLAHADQFDNDVKAYNRYTLLGGGGYAQSLENLPCTAGVGMFAQGGAGGVFRNLNTAFGTQDNFSALFGLAKFTAGMGCQVTDRLSIGGTIGLVYASIEQSLYRNTSKNLGGGQFFPGTRLEDAQGVKPTFKIGLQYKLTPQITLGAAYTEKTKVPMTGGALEADFSDLGIGTVKYRDARLYGFALPREVAIGAAFRPDDAWLLSFKLNWINWSDALNDVELKAKDPNIAVPGPLQTLNSKTIADWKDQWVVATGLAYQANDKTTLYAGYNYGKNPIPKEHSTPFIAGILEHHFTAGAAYKFNPEWTFTGGVEYDPKVKVNYNNPQLPFGNAQLRNEALFLHFMLSRQW